MDNALSHLLLVLTGVAVSSTMFGTTVLLYMVMLIIWETNFFLATAFLIGFGFVDMVYVTGQTLRPPCLHLSHEAFCAYARLLNESDLQACTN